MLEAIREQIKSIENQVAQRRSAIVTRAEQLYILKQLEKMYEEPVKITKKQGGANVASNTKRTATKHTGSQ